ncbi:MAG: NAD(P)/FAD-dependent oxidoreductase [Halobacteriales archaeon]
MDAVVGGGLAGLAAAYRLKRAGHEVTLYEAADRLGGLASTVETRGDPIERFYHHLSRSEQTIVGYAEHLGLGDELEWRVGQNAYYVDGVVHPLDTIWQIAAYPHLSLYDKFRLGLLTLGIDASGGLPRPGAFNDLAAYDDDPVEPFILEHTSERVYESFFEPLLRAKFGDRMDEVSTAWLLGRIKFRSERDPLRGEILGYLDGGFQRLTEALVEAVGRENIETAAPVEAIEVTGGDDPRVDAIAVGGPHGTREVPVDAVVVATMPHVLEELVGFRCAIEFQGTVCSVIAMDEPLTDTYWLNIADEAPFGALIEHTNFIPPERYGGEHLLYAVRYVQDLDGSFWRTPTEAIEARWLDGVESMFPGFDRDAVRWIETSRAARTAPIYDRGYLDRVVPYDLGAEVAAGLYYAGMATRAQYPERSLDGALRAGEAAAAHRLGQPEAVDVLE